MRTICHAETGGDRMDVICPTCGEKMKKTKNYPTYKCTNPECGEQFMACPKSIFGITEK